MKNLVFKMSLALSVAALVACAEAPVSPSASSTKTAAAVSTVSSVSSVKTVSLRNPTGLRADDCPTSPNAWHNEPLQKLVKAANACVQYNKTERTEQIGNFLAQKYSNDAWGAFYLSVAALDRKDYPRALWMIELALKKAPHLGLAYYQKGRVHQALGEMGAANESYSTAAKESPDLSDAHLFLAQWSARDHNYKEAAVQYQAVIQAEPENHLAYSELGEAYIQLSKMSDAVDAYEKAVNISPRNLSYRLRLAFLYETGKKDYVAALSSYKRIQSMAHESRTPAEEINFDLNDKIKKLESLVNPEPKTDSKLTQVDKTSNKQVKK